AEKLCNKVAIIQDGKLMAAGKMEDLTKNHSLEEVFMEVAANA
ncbi:MAG: ABC transporter ATP-binding protein, partial [Acetivibrio sp.]